jgi:hypothetical protein
MFSKKNLSKRNYNLQEWDPQDKLEVGDQAQAQGSQKEIQVGGQEQKYGGREQYG